MGREAEVRKNRTCKSCEKTFKWTARVLKNHYNQCKRLNDIGLVMPESSIISLDDKKEG